MEALAHTLFLWLFLAIVLKESTHFYSHSNDGWFKMERIVIGLVFLGFFLV